MKQKVTNQTRRKMLIGGAAVATTPLWLNAPMRKPTQLRSVFQCR